MNTEYDVVINYNIYKIKKMTEKISVTVVGAYILIIVLLFFIVVVRFKFYLFITSTISLLSIIFFYIINNILYIYIN